MNRTQLQAAVDATPDGGTLVLPDGLHVVDMNDGPIRRVKSITVLGASRAGCVIRVVPPTSIPLQTVRPLFEYTGPDGSFLRWGNMTIEGPTARIADQLTPGVALNDRISCIHYAWAHTPNSTVMIDRLTVVGLFESAVQRSGGGTLLVQDSDLEAWECAVKAFSRQEDPGQVWLFRNKFRGERSKDGTSNGLYAHDHLAVVSEDNDFWNWQAAGLSAHGSRSSTGRQWTSTNDRFHACAMAQTPRTHAIFRNPICDTGETNKEGLVRGSLTIIGGQLGATRLTLQNTPGETRRLTFKDLTWAPRIRVPVLIAADSIVTFEGVRWIMEELASRTFEVIASSTAMVTMRGCVIDDSLGRTGGPPKLVALQGPSTLDWGDTLVITPRSEWWTKAPTSKIIGAPSVRRP